MTKTGDEGIRGAAFQQNFVLADRPLLTPHLATAGAGSELVDFSVEIRICAKTRAVWHCSDSF